MQYKVTNKQGAPLFIPNWQKIKKDGEMKVDYRHNPTAWFPYGYIFDVVSVSSNGNTEIGKMSNGKGIFLRKGKTIYAEQVIIPPLVTEPSETDLLKAEIEVLKADIEELKAQLAAKG